jgi:hypothetical protein
MGGQKLIDVRVVGELLKHQAHGYAGSPDNRPSAQNLGICRDPVFVLRSLRFFHGKPIIPHRHQR